MAGSFNTFIPTPDAIQAPRRAPSLAFPAAPSTPTAPITTVGAGLASLGTGFAGGVMRGMEQQSADDLRRQALADALAGRPLGAPLPLTQPDPPPFSGLSGIGDHIKSIFGVGS